MTEDDRAALGHLASKLRLVASPVGPQHAFWELMMDIEAFLQGKPLVVPRSAVQLLEAGICALRCAARGDAAVEATDPPAATGA
jgi:hypothetical protein